MPDPQIIGDYVDRSEKAALRLLGHLPLDDLTFRHEVAEEVVRRLRDLDRYWLAPR